MVFRDPREPVRTLATPLALGVAVLCLALAGCAAGAMTPSRDRQDIIDRIVARSVKVMIEQGGHRIGSGSGVVVASRAGESGVEAVSYVLTAAHILGSKDEAEVFVGFPWGKRLGLFSGIVSQVPASGKEDVAADEGAEQTIVVDAAASKGVSGGGVFREATGSLLGVVEGYQTASISLKDRSQTYSVRVPMPGETFVVPIAAIRRFLVEAGLEEALGQDRELEDPKD